MILTIDYNYYDVYEIMLKWIKKYMGTKLNAIICDANVNITQYTFASYCPVQIK